MAETNEHPTTEVGPEEMSWAQGFTDVQFEMMVLHGGTKTFDGCFVEPDGFCHHGHWSPLVLLGLI